MTHRRACPLRHVPTLLIAALAACESPGGAGEPGATVQVDTIDGIERVTYGAGAGWREDAGWRVDSAAAVEIGRLEGAEEYLFGQVTGAAVGTDGRIWVADNQAKEVRIFTGEGGFVARFGRAGDGPGEFRFIGGIGRGPDGTIAVVDDMLGRVSLFAPDGAFQRSFRLERPFRVIGQTATLRFDDQGRYHELSPLSNRGGIDSTGAFRYGPGGGLERKVLLWAHEPEQVTIMEGDRPMASLGIPFAPRPQGAIDSRGRAYVTAAEEYRIAVIGPAGDTLRLLAREVPLAPIQPARRDSARAAFAETYGAVAGTEPRDLPEIPGEMPPILALRVDEADYLWVLRPAEDPSIALWDVFDPEGGFLGELRHPAMRVMHIDERSMVGIVSDEMQVPRVRVLPLIRE